jgi:hypothetical protein
MVDFSIKQNDREPVFRATVTQRDGTAVNLTGASVTFVMRNRESKAIKVNAAMTIDDATAGRVSYPWTALDTDTVGFYEAEIKIVLSGGKQLTVPTTGYLSGEVAARLA